jgi:hypothetical protein
MTQDPTAPAVTPNSVAKDGVWRQAVTGVVPPRLAEAQIREVFPSLNGTVPAVAGLGKALVRSIVLAPLGWLVLAPLFLKKIAPFVCTRYTLTNRRLMIQRGLKPSPKQEVPLSEIDQVRLVPESVDDFFRSGDLEIISGGKVRMHLAGVPEPEGFQRAIVNAYTAWVPEKSTGLGPFLPASAKL